jgi:hypothetical protein
MPELGTGNPVIMMTVQHCTIINLPTLFEIRMVGLKKFICSNFELYNKTTEWTPISPHDKAQRWWKRLVIAVTTFSMARRRRSPELRWRREYQRLPGSNHASHCHYLSFMCFQYLILSSCLLCHRSLYYLRPHTLWSN